MPRSRLTPVRIVHFVHFVSGDAQNTVQFVSTYQSGQLEHRISQNQTCPMVRGSDVLLNEHMPWC